MKGPDHLSDGDAVSVQQNSTSTSLIDQVKQGDQAKWEQLVRLYNPLVRYWCRGKVTCPEDTEDVVQEVFTTVFRSLGEFKKQPHRGAFRAWLKKITGYKLQEHWKLGRKQPVAAGGSEALERIAALPDPFGEESSTEEDASERCLLLRGAMELVRLEFENTTWQAAWQTAVESQSPAVVGHALGMKVAAVYVAKSKVLARLRQVMGDLLE